MDGEEELEELVRETYAVEEIDMDYEFDAARFYDFSRVETDCEAREAERWLESYGNYPPSPFIIKLKWRKGVPTGVVNTSALSKDVEDVNANDRELNNHVTQDIISQSKAKSPVKSSLLRSSTLMKPTASHLAKLDQLHLVQSIRSLRLKNKLGNIDDKSSQNSSVTDDLATKRQKLEAGYLSKDAQLKHQALLLHKVPKQGLKTTTPREPDLETAHRAERRWYKVNAKSGEEAKPNARAFKAYPLNRKILKSPSLPLTRRSKPHLPEFQVFRLKTSERTMQNKCNNEPSMPCQSSSFQNENTEYKRSNSGKSFSQTVYNFKARTPYKMKLSRNGKVPLAQKVKQATTVTSLGLNFSTDRRIQDELPIRLFSKLCPKGENAKLLSRTGGALAYDKNPIANEVACVGTLA
ncbi:protein TPX2 [Morus notabilis]|uniref:protein TPX2 n=1 Tax=Morus notabilis TaxID=981085 RepID=UPI000CED3993|nr:protein TPX2 [Morus notabilis]